MEEGHWTIFSWLYYQLEASNLLPAFLKGEHGEKYFGLIIFSWMVIIGLVVLSILATRRLKKVPGRLQGALEFVVDSLANLLDSLIGPGGRKYLPLLGTTFIFLFCLNLLGLVPGMISPTANYNTTIAFSLVVIIFIQAYGIREHGFLGYLKHLSGSPQGIAMWCLVPLMFLIHSLGELVKPLSLSLRLFCNIHGEDTIILSIAGLVQSAGIWAPVPFILLLFLTILMAALASLQAFIFTALSCIYIMLITAHTEA